MALILKQHKLFVTKIFEIKDHSLGVNIKNLAGHIQYDLTFEEISNRVIRRKSHHLFTLIPAVLLFICLIMTCFSHFFEDKGSSWEDILVFGILCLIFICLATLNFENVVEINLYNMGKLSFYAKLPSKITVDEFIMLFLKKQKEYLVSRYAKADPYVSAEQLATNLKWLRDKNIINDEELDNFRINILPKPGGGSSAGFKFNPSSN